MAIAGVSLTAHWQASDLDGLEADSAVASWPSRDSGPVLTQADPAAQPILRKGALNGQSVVEFAGAHWLEGVLDNGTDVSFTRVAVVKVPNQNGPEQFIWGGNRYYQEGHNFRRGGYGISAYVGVHVGSTVYGWSAAVDNNWHVLTVVWDAATGAHQIYVDGTLNLDTTVSPPARSTNRFSLGARLLAPGDGAELFLDGHIAAVFNADSVLSAADRAAIHSYCQDTYGIAVADYVEGDPDPDPVPGPGEWIDTFDRPNGPIAQEPDSRWTVIDTEGQGREDTYVIEDGSLVGGDYDVFMLAESSADGFVEMRMGLKNFQASAAPIFRYVDAGNFLSANVFGVSPTLYVNLFRTVDGTGTTVDSWETSMVIPSEGVEITLRVEYVGDQITVLVNGAEVGTATESTHQAGTRIGLRSAGLTPIRYVYSTDPVLPDPDPEPPSVETIFYSPTGAPIALLGWDDSAQEWR